MANSIINTVASYLSSLAATNEICVAFGSTFTEGSNLFMYSEPYDTDDMITLIPYGGSPPDRDGQKYSSNMQIRAKCSSRKTVMTTQQSMINKLHMNQLGGLGQMMSNNSVPISLEDTEAGEMKIAVTSYRIKYIKI